MISGYLCLEAFQCSDVSLTRDWRDVYESARCEDRAGVCLGVLLEAIRALQLSSPHQYRVSLISR